MNKHEKKPLRPLRHNGFAYLCSYSTHIIITKNLLTCNRLTHKRGGVYDD